MHGALAARSPVATMIVLAFVAMPAHAQDPVPECVDVFVQPQEQSGTEVTPVATGSQFGVVVMLDAADDVGLFASAQSRPLDCPSEIPPRPPQGSVDPGALEPATTGMPSGVTLPQDVQRALDDLTGLLP